MYCLERESMKNSLINKLLSQFVTDIRGILTILVYERKDYSLLSYFDNPDLNEDQSNVHHSLIDQFIDEIDNKYGKQNDFLLIKENQKNKLIFCSTDSYSMILAITEKETMDIDLKIYSVYVAGKLKD